MKTYYIATNKALAIAHQHGEKWSIDLQLVGLATHCVAVDPQRPKEVYCGTFRKWLRPER